MDHGITLGVEEELFLVDPDTCELIVDPDIRIFQESRNNSGPDKVVRELLRSQIEINTRICHSIAEVRQSLQEIRRTVDTVARKYGAVIMAASTHPFARWQDQIPTPEQRYESFIMLYQDAVRNFNVSGMHCHAGFDGDADLRVRVMSAMRRYLPIMLALSTSSPFSIGRETGLKSSRMNILSALTRTGMPNALKTWREFDEIVEVCKRMETIRDASELWWDIRPSCKYPTVELRICDVCPRVEDAVSIVALYACLIRHFLRLNARGELPVELPTEAINENRWLAQRYGIVAFFGDPVNGGRVDIGDCLDDLLDMVAEDADALECQRELAHLKSVVSLGAAADLQQEVFHAARLAGKSDQEALRDVVTWAVDQTVSFQA